MAGTHCGAVCGELQPVGRTHVGEVCGELSPWEGPHAGAEEQCEEEGAAETTCDEQTTTPIPCPLALLGGRREITRE